jgi:arylsulfatase A-like enzyme
VGGKSELMIKVDKISYGRGALIGTLVYFALFVYCILFHVGFTVMGVEDPELSRLAGEYLLWPTMLFEIKALVAYLVIGAGMGVFSAGVARGAGRYLFGGRSGLFYHLLVLATLFLVHGLILARAVVLYPQLFSEFMYEAGGFWKEVQIILTDSVGLWPIRAALWLLAGAGFFIWAGSMWSIWKAHGSESARTKAKITAAFLICIAMLLTLIRVFPSPHNNRGPNLLILCADSIRPDRLSSYGYHRETSPALDRLAENGVRFEEVYAQLPRTFPSWLSMLTGKYPFQHGITSMFPTVADRQKDFNALPAMLKDKGWATAVVADSAGDIFPRIELGFDYVDAPGFNFQTLGKMHGLEIHTHLLPYIANPIGREIFPILKEFANLGNPAFVGREVKHRLKEFLREERFMLAAFFSGTHFPYSPPWPYYRMYTAPGYRGLSKYSKFNKINVEEVITDQDIRQIGAVFDGAIRATDDAVAGIMEALEDYGLDKNTVIVFIADHGENLYEHEYMMGHGEHLRGRYSLKIPLIIYDPRREYPVRVVRSRLRSIDLMPTLLDLLEMPIPEGLPAVSLKPLMEGAPDNLDLPVYAETGLWFVQDGPGFFQRQRIRYPDVTGVCWFEPHYDYEVVIRDDWQDFTEVAKHRMLIHGDYKVIYNPLPDGVKWELYDLSKDPEERHDLSGERPAELEGMKKELFDLILQRPGWTVAGDYYLPEEAR